MKTLFALLLTPGLASAAVITVSSTSFPNFPDGDSSGAALSLTVTEPGQTITHVEVDVNIIGVATNFGGPTPAFLGDLYLYLSNGTDLAVLLNRPGRRAGSPGGYADNQAMNVTFSTLATDDIHNYRVSLLGSHTSPLTAPLTGLWQPDGRAVDPAAVLDTSPRTAGLEVFAGAPASGTWTLFAADLSTGAAHRIPTWTLRLTTIPEPGTTALLLLATALGTRRRRTAS